MGGGGKSPKVEEPPEPDPIPTPESEKEPESSAVRDEQRKKLQNTTGHSGTLSSSPLGVAGDAINGIPVASRRVSGR